MHGTVSWSSDAQHDTFIITSTHECRVFASSSNVVGEIWIISHALDQDAIDRLEAIQLFTTAQHQGWISDIDAGIWSTFELVILRSPADINIEAVGTIFSHKVQPTAKIFMDQSGPRIEKSNDFFKLLEPGSAIAVRVCAQYPGWQNIAKQGRLELVLSKKGSTIGPNTFFVKNDTTGDIFVRVTASGEPSGDETFCTISPGYIRQWDRSALQVAFVQREDNGLMETMGVKPGSTYSISSRPPPIDSPTMDSFPIDPSPVDSPLFGSPVMKPSPIEPPPNSDLLQAAGEVTSMGADEESPTKQFSAMFKLQALDRRPVTFVGSSTISLPFFQGPASMKYAKIADLSGSHTFSGTIGNGYFSIKLDNGVYMTAEVTGGPNNAFEFGGSGHWGLAR